MEEEGHNLISIRLLYIHELEPACGDQTACDGLVDKTNILLVAYLCTYTLCLPMHIAGYHKDYKYIVHLKQQIC